MPAAVHRSAMPASRQRLTLPQTRRMVPFMFSMMLVQASERLSSRGRPSRVTVRISSMPSRMLAADARCFAFEPASEIPDQLLGLLGVVQLPGLAQRLSDRDMEVLG